MAVGSANPSPPQKAIPINVSRTKGSTTAHTRAKARAFSRAQSRSPVRRFILAFDTLGAEFFAGLRGRARTGFWFPERSSLVSNSMAES